MAHLLKLTSAFKSHFDVLARIARQASVRRATRVTIDVNVPGQDGGRR
jgi:hypothetical protein